MAKPSPQLQPTDVQVQPVLAVQIEGQSGTKPEQIGPAMGAAFQALQQFVASHKLSFAGPPRAIYHHFDENATRFTVAFPIAARGSAPAAEGGVRVGEIPGGPAFRFTHTGPYEQLRQTYDAITEWMKQQGLLKTDADWDSHMPVSEEYLNDPTSTPPAELVTHIYVPKRAK